VVLPTRLLAATLSTSDGEEFFEEEDHLFFSTNVLRDSFHNPLDGPPHLWGQLGFKEEFGSGTSPLAFCGVDWK